ncbi:hypothetical protein QTP86_006329, partial [Hemibagrus guttatus]
MILIPFLTQNKIILDPLTFSEARFRPSLEERLESIISGAALMADSSCTRDDRRERIVAECNAVRQALQDLLSEYMNNGTEGIFNASSSYSISRSVEVGHGSGSKGEIGWVLPPGYSDVMKSFRGGRCPARRQRRRVLATPCSHPPAPWGVPDPSETDIIAPEPSFVGGRRSVRVLGGGHRSELLLGGGRRLALLLGCGRHSVLLLGCGRHSVLLLGCGRRSAPPLGCGRRVGPFGLAKVEMRSSKLSDVWSPFYQRTHGGGLARLAREDGCPLVEQTSRRPPDK